MSDFVSNGGNWPKMPAIANEIWEYEKLLRASIERHCGALPYPMVFRESRFVPKDQIWLIDSLGKVHRIVNIANYLAEGDGISLCVGEMK